MNQEGYFKQLLKLWEDKKGSPCPVCECMNTQLMKEGLYCEKCDKTYSEEFLEAVKKKKK